MKKLLTVLIAIFITFNSYAMTKTITLPEEKYVTITATLDKDEYADWEPINLKIKIVNKSDKLFLYDRAANRYIFPIKITPENSPSKIYTFKPFDPMSFRQTSVYPGQFLEYEFDDLNQNIKFPKQEDQEYKVEISIPYWLRNDEGVLDVKPKEVTLGLKFKIVYKGSTGSKQKFIEASNNKDNKKISTTKTMIQYAIETKKEIKVLSKELKKKLNSKFLNKQQITLNFKEKEELFKLLGLPAYIANTNLLGGVGWLFEDGSILCSDMEFRLIELMPYTKKVAYRFYWNKMDIPKNVKKVFNNN